MRDALWRRVWNDANVLPSGLPRVAPDSPERQSPSDRLLERLGSNSNPSHFILLEKAVNAAKGQLEIFKRPMSEDKMEENVEKALAGDDEALQRYMAPLREVRTHAVFLFFVACLACNVYTCRYLKGSYS